MNKGLRAILIGPLLISWFAHAEEPTHESAVPVVGSHRSWEPQKLDQLKVKLGGSIPRYDFDIEAPKGNSDKIANFEPNSPGKLNVNLAYRNLAGTISVVQPGFQKDTEELGTSSGTDFQLRFYGKRTYEFFYQSYKGYYLLNSDQLDPAYAGQTKKIQRPDLETQNYGVNFFWNLHDDDFSFAVAFDQNGHQIESNWGLSWFPPADWLSSFFD